MNPVSFKVQIAPISEKENSSSSKQIKFMCENNDQLNEWMEEIKSHYQQTQEKLQNKAKDIGINSILSKENLLSLEKFKELADTGDLILFQSKAVAS